MPSPTKVGHDSQADTSLHMGNLARNAVEDAFYPWNMVATQWVSRIRICIGADVMSTIFVNEINMEVSFFRKAGDNLVIFSIL